MVYHAISITPLRHKGYAENRRSPSEITRAHSPLIQTQTAQIVVWLGEDKLQRVTGTIAMEILVGGDYKADSS